ncbi:MAG: hypothetical protein Q8R02_15870 [Hyphomonadaceae bacterium]|nr:hypothetical protein [Hyphomonadaceae bacterium]
MWQLAKLVIGLAGVVVIGFSLAWITLTDGPPGNLTVVNEVGNADCVVTFKGGESPWTFSLARNESRQKFFLFGAPPIESTDCRSGQRVVVATELEAFSSCLGLGDPPNKIVLTEKPEASTIQC